MADAQNAGLALAEAGVLDAFVTSFAWRREGRLARAVGQLPAGIADRALRQLGRRSIEAIDHRLVHAYPFWELVRTAANRAGPLWGDRAWDRLSHSFDALVARRYVPRTQAVHAFEYTALRTFERARDSGVARILHLPSLDSRRFEEIQAREKERWPELRGPHDAYFDARFESRYHRRRREIALADVIVTNSSLTARSHIEAGAPAERVVAVPLAAPRTIEQVRETAGAAGRPLVAIWAGSFSLGKGAHYALDAWQALGAGGNARLEVYGRVCVPERVLAHAGAQVRFHGSVPQVALFEAYERADVLVLPTLSDGFGLVVAEAMAHGLPVIATDQAGAADLVTADNGIIVPAGDARALAEALRWCLDNRTRLAEMRHHALSTARGRQWSDYRRELIGALDGALSRAGYKPQYGTIAPAKTTETSAASPGDIHVRVGR